MMASIQKILVLILLMATVHAGDLRVSLLNGTRNAPGSVDRVALLDLSAGMVEVAAEVDVVNTVTFSDIATTGQSQFLVRATLDGVTYSSMFVPSPGVSNWEASLTVYDVVDDVKDLNASVPFFVIYGFEDKLRIQKRTILENMSNPPVTYATSPGIAKVYIPDEISSLDNFTFKAGTMPVRTSQIDTEDGQVIPNPIKPGQSEIDIEYSLPYDPNGTSYSELMGYDIDHFHVYVMPIDLVVTAPGLSREGTDNDNGLAIYAMEGLKAGTKLDFTIRGAGMSESGPAPQEHQQQQNTGRIVIENRLDTSVELTLAAVLVMAVIIALFVSITQQNEDLKQESVDMLKQQKKDLLRQYSKLDDSEQKDRILYRLVSVYKTLDRIK